jgi:hypothetical protein
MTSDDELPYPLASPLHREQNFPFMAILNVGYEGGKVEPLPLRFPQNSSLSCPFYSSCSSCFFSSCPSCKSPVIIVLIFLILSILSFLVRF